MSMRSRVIGMLLAIVAAGVLPVQAEMYKYRDAQGNTCYTDNLAQIPEDQRPKAQALETIDADAAVQATVDKNALELENSFDQDETQTDMVVDEETISALNLRKKELDAEFSGLMAEKYKLLQEKEKLSGLAGRDVEARESYEGKVADLNNRIADYKTRRDAFQNECEVVKKALKPSSPEDEDAEILAE